MRPRRLEDFAGTWRLEREIEDALGPPARFTGQAVWSEAPGGLMLHESGQMEIAGQGRFMAERRYLWAADLSVFFPDGRFFHQVPAAGGPAEHWCDPDHYAVDYAFDGWPEFRATWSVKGPRKSYRMVSVYRRG